ncbi:hypothetical protein N657DRAFT_206648 [Parathielavia appendiculata]|uniref:Uncharacterized protein n=1 Tax=Parathielavia appendiculata TaxID=2587402 RepID=A0AAN6Z6B6_9PEZI|nr:hypothetical protein N657DRAFT_206648 [Parathielavia appendiculata]
MPIKRASSTKSLDRSPTAASQGTRKRPSHIVDDGHASKRRKHLVYPLRREDVRIQIGSQERRPGETSSITRSWVTPPVPDSQSAPRRHAKPPNPRSTKDHLVLSHIPPGDKLQRSSLPMREPSSDQSESGERRCCVSSDADGHILTTSFPLLSHPLSVRPVPEAFYDPERFDSETTGTAAAQVGRIVSPVAPSQRIENIRWHQWLGQPSSPVSSHVAVKGSKRSRDYKVSPGVSERRRPEQKPHIPSHPPGGLQPSKPKKANSGRSRDPAKMLSSSNSSEILSRYEGLVARLRQLGQFDTPESNGSPSEPPIGVGTENTNSSIKGHGEKPVCHSSSRVHDGSSFATESANPVQRIDSSNANVLDLEHRPTKRSSLQAPSAVPQDHAEPEGADPDEAWKTFVFGDKDSDELGKAAFEEARHDAVRHLQPSTSPTAIDEGLEYDGQSNIVTVGTLYTRHDNETSITAEARSPSEAFGGVNISYDASSIESASPSVISVSDESNSPSSVEVNAGTSDVSGQESIAGASGSFEPSSLPETEISASHLHVGTPSMTTSMAVAPAQSDMVPSESDTAGEHFRFSQPKIFVGRSSLTQPKPVTDRGPGITLAKRRTGRPRRRANDGRADIRALPNYSSDPIEDFEEGKRPSRGERAPRSLFPALELS